MTVIYYSSALAAKAVQSPEFVTRGIEKETTARPGDCSIIGFPHVKQLAYDDYRSNICAFLYATSVKSKVACDVQHYFPKLDSALYIPLEVPPLVVAPTDPFQNEDARSKFQESLGVQSEMIRYINRPMFRIDNISFDQIKALPRSLNVLCPSPPNATSLFGLRQYLITVKAVSLFLATHSYPAFVSEDDNDYLYEDHSHLASAKFLKPLNTYRFNPRESSISEEEKSTFAVDAPYVESDESWSKVKQHIQATDVVVIAKPSPLRPSINYGPPNEIPALPGYLFPYFPNTLEPALGDLRNTFAALFMNLLGDSQEKLEAGWRDWVQGAGYWYKTEAGMRMVHILSLIRAALDAQARLFLIIQQGVYLGGAILGARFTIFKNGLRFAPGTATEVHEAACILDEHSQALKEICGVLSKLELKDELISTITIDPRSIKGTRQLFEEVQRREKAVDEDLEKITENLGKLHFVETYNNFALDKIIDLFSRLSTSARLEPPAPMYLPATNLYDTSLEFNLLSAYGPMAPSFVDQRGNEYQIPQGPSAPDPLSVRDSAGKRDLDFILISGKKLPTAVNDLRHVVNKRSVRQNPLERASGYRTIKFTGNARDQIWEMMKLLPYDKSKGRKRVGEDEEMQEAGPSKKQKKSGQEVTFEYDF